MPPEHPIPPEDIGTRALPAAGGLDLDRERARVVFDELKPLMLAIRTDYTISPEQRKELGRIAAKMKVLRHDPDEGDSDEPPAADSA
ncbi:hypothetical protein Q8F55_007001 [Vanrija albida]|uniref:Uncharacterized protein n=1 Tax=Vanrija albida TaxID=181172 RepID=A0ABR3PZL7_9TREE